MSIIGWMLFGLAVAPLGRFSAGDGVGVIGNRTAPHRLIALAN